MLLQGYLWLLLTELAVLVNILDFLVLNVPTSPDKNSLSLLGNHLQDPVKEKEKKANHLSASSCVTESITLLY